MPVKWERKGLWYRQLSSTLAGEPEIPTTIACRYLWISHSNDLNTFASLLFFFSTLLILILFYFS